MKDINLNSHKIVYGFILLCLISSILLMYNKLYIREGLANNKSNKIVLMGDSILKNNVYVGKGKSVEDILMEQYDGEVLNLAKDNTTISDIYQQINSLPNELNENDTTIFVSVGGNDILNKYVYVTKDPVDVDNFTVLYQIYSGYKNALRKIREKMPKAKIMIMNLYYPQSVKYLRYRELIKKWNDLLDEYAAEPMNKINDVLDLSLNMTDINDFALCIEPSETGSVKIAREILILSKE